MAKFCNIFTGPSAEFACNNNFKKVMPEDQKIEHQFKSRQILQKTKAFKKADKFFFKSCFLDCPDGWVYFNNACYKWVRC